MIELFDKVIIKSSNILGTVVDISLINGNKRFVVEANEPNVKEGYGEKWKLFDCNENEISKI